MEPLSQGTVTGLSGEDGGIFKKSLNLEKLRNSFTYQIFDGPKLDSYPVEEDDGTIVGKSWARLTDDQKAHFLRGGGTSFINYRESGGGVSIGVPAAGVSLSRGRYDVEMLRMRGTDFNCYDDSGSIIGKYSVGTGVLAFIYLEVKRGKIGITLEGVAEAFSSFWKKVDGLLLGQ